MGITPLENDDTELLIVFPNGLFLNENIHQFLFCEGVKGQVAVSNDDKRDIFSKRRCSCAGSDTDQ